jgi:hypothetical protein
MGGKSLGGLSMARSRLRACDILQFSSRLPPVAAEFRDQQDHAGVDAGHRARLQHNVMTRTGEPLGFHDRSDLGPDDVVEIGDSAVTVAKDGGEADGAGSENVCEGEKLTHEVLQSIAMDEIDRPMGNREERVPALLLLTHHANPGSESEDRIFRRAIDQQHWSVASTQTGAVSTG